MSSEASEWQAPALSPSHIDLQQITELLSSAEEIYSPDAYRSSQFQSKKSSCISQESAFRVKEAQLHKKLEAFIKASQNAITLQKTEAELALESILKSIQYIQANYTKQKIKKDLIDLKRAMEKLFTRLVEFLVKQIFPILSSCKGFRKTVDLILKSTFQNEVEEKLRKSKKYTSFSKTHQFFLHLPISKAKIPLCFYLLLESFQGQLRSRAANFQSSVITLNKRKEKKTQEIHLSNEWFQQEVQYICQYFVFGKTSNTLTCFFMETICDLYGCFEYPITVYFGSALVELVSERILDELPKFKKLNDGVAQALASINCSLQNFGFFLSALDRNIKSKVTSFSLVPLRHSPDELKQDFLCDYCGVSLSDLLQIQTIFHSKVSERLHSVNESKFSVKICHSCCSQFERDNFEEEQRQIPSDWKSYFFEKYGKFLLSSFCLSSLWRLEYDSIKVQEYKENQLVILGLLSGKTRPFVIQKQLHMNSLQNKIVDAVPLRCLKSLLLYSGSAHLKSQPSVEDLYAKVVKIVLTLLSVQDEKFKGTWLVWAEMFASHLPFHLKQQNFAEVMTQQQPENNQQSKVQHALRLLLKGVKNKLSDKQSFLKLKAMKTLFIFQSPYQSVKLKRKVVAKVAEVLEGHESREDEVLTLIVEEVMKTKVSKIDSLEDTQEEMALTSDVIKTFLHCVSKKSQASKSTTESVTKGLKFTSINKLFIRMKQLIEKQNSQKFGGSTADFQSYGQFVLEYLSGFDLSIETVQILNLDGQFLQKMIKMVNQQKEINVTLIRNTELLFAYYKKVFTFRPQEPNTNRKSSKKMKNKSKSESKCQSSLEDMKLNLGALLRTLLECPVRNFFKWSIMGQLFQINLSVIYNKNLHNLKEMNEVRVFVNDLKTQKHLLQQIKEIQAQIQDTRFEYIEPLLKAYYWLNVANMTESTVETFSNVFKNAVYIVMQKFNEVFQHKSTIGSISPQQLEFFFKCYKIVTIVGCECQKANKMRNAHELTFEKSTVFSNSLKATSKFLNMLERNLEGLEVNLKHSILKQTLDGLISIVEVSASQYSPYSQILQKILFCLETTQRSQKQDIDQNSTEKSTAIVSSLISLLEKVVAAKNYTQINQIKGLMKFVKNQLFFKENRIQKITQWTQRADTMPKFYSLVAEFLYQSVISLHEVKNIIILGLFLNNQIIFREVCSIVQHFNQTDTDGLLLTDLNDSLYFCYMRLTSDQSYKVSPFIDSEKMQFLANISKSETHYFANESDIMRSFSNNSEKFVFGTELNRFRMRQTFIKKLAIIIDELCSGRSSVRQQIFVLNFYCQILGSITKVDSFQLKELIFSLESATKRMMPILEKLRAKLEEDQNQKGTITAKEVWDQITVVVAIAELLNTLIGFSEERPLKILKKEIQVTIDSKKMKISHFEIKVNTARHKKDSQQTLCYQSVMPLYLDLRRNTTNNEQFSSQDAMCFIQRADMMYDILYHNHRARMITKRETLQTEQNARNNNQKKPKKRKNKKHYRNKNRNRKSLDFSKDSSSSEDDCSKDSEFTDYTEQSLFENSSHSLKTDHNLSENYSDNFKPNKQKQHHSEKLTRQPLTRSQKNARAINRNKGKSVSLPKSKLLRLETIDEDLQDVQNVQDDEALRGKVSRRSLRLIEKQSKRV